MDNFYQIRQKYLNKKGNIKNKKKAINYTNTLLDTNIYIILIIWIPIIQFPSVLLFYRDYI